MNEIIRLVLVLTLLALVMGLAGVIWLWVLQEYQEMTKRKVGGGYAEERDRIEREIIHIAEEHEQRSSQGN